MTFPAHLVTDILDNAHKQGRSSLYEHEVYQVLSIAGCKTPQTLFVPRTQLSNSGSLRDDLSAFVRSLPDDATNVVVKVVSADIAHKTDVGGVKMPEADVASITSTLKQMNDEIPDKFATWLSSGAHLLDGYEGMNTQDIAKRVDGSIVGFLVAEKVKVAQRGVGSELLAGLRNNREFGPVLTMGVGGVDTELLGSACKTGLAVMSGSAALLDEHQLLDLLRPTIAYQRLAGQLRGGSRLVADAELLTLIRAFRNLAHTFGDHNDQSTWTITELEVNPLAVSDGTLIALDGLLSFRDSRELSAPRPASSIDALLHPKSIAVVGVSAKGMNMGRIILRNILQTGFDPAHTYIVRSGIDSIDDVRCVPSIAALPERVDTLVLAVGAQQVPEMVEQIVETNKAVGVILIAGGMGEKSGGQSLEQRVKQAVKRSRQLQQPMVINGGNSLGIVSRPGSYHTLFIPQNKLPLTTDGQSNVAFLSQSGAYMITRMSKLSWISPRYAVSAGNQVDLTIADYLQFLAEDKNLQTLAVYVEGFQDNDGLHFARAVRRAVAHGKDVIFYKAGRTTEGKTATSGHTASLAGDYQVCASVVAAQGAHVAATFTDFLALIKLSAMVGNKRWRGGRLGAMSNAGYEAVGIADSLRGDGWSMSLAQLSPTTRDKLAAALADGKLDTLVDVRNPMDITPMATDASHEGIMEAFMDAEEVDLLLCASVPLTPAMATLSAGVPDDQLITTPGSLPHRLGQLAKRTDKPLVACIDSGELYDPMAKLIEAQGVPTFRSVERAMKTMGQYLHGRLARHK